MFMVDENGKKISVMKKVQHAMRMNDSSTGASPSKSVPFYQKWQFWLIIAIILVVICYFFCMKKKGTKKSEKKGPAFGFYF
jgi:hypothetical protein